jgi:hypothetical protein
MVVKFVSLLSIERIDRVLELISLYIAEISLLDFLPEPFGQTSHQSDE